MAGEVRLRYTHSSRYITNKGLKTHERHTDTLTLQPTGGDRADRDQPTVQSTGGQARCGRPGRQVPPAEAENSGTGSSDGSGPTTKHVARSCCHLCRLLQRESCTFWGV